VLVGAAVASRQHRQGRKAREANMWEHIRCVQSIKESIMGRMGGGQGGRARCTCCWGFALPPH
jgi:hypothetical protein